MLASAKVILPDLMILILTFTIVPDLIYYHSRKVNAARRAEIMLMFIIQGA